MAARYLKAAASDLFTAAELRIEKTPTDAVAVVREASALYSVRPTRKRLQQRNPTIRRRTGSRAAARSAPSSLHVRPMKRHKKSRDADVLDLIDFPISGFA